MLSLCQADMMLAGRAADGIFRFLRSPPVSWMKGNTLPSHASCSRALFLSLPCPACVRPDFAGQPNSTLHETVPTAPSHTAKSCDLTEAFKVSMPAGSCHPCASRRGPPSLRFRYEAYCRLPQRWRLLPGTRPGPLMWHLLHNRVLVRSPGCGQAANTDGALVTSSSGAIPAHAEAQIDETTAQKSKAKAHRRSRSHFDAPQALKGFPREAPAIRSPTRVARDLCRFVRAQTSVLRTPSITGPIIAPNKWLPDPPPGLWTLSLTPTQPAAIPAAFWARLGAGRQAAAPPLHIPPRSACAAPAGQDEGAPCERAPAAARKAQLQRKCQRQAGEPHGIVGRPAAAADAAQHAALGALAA